MLHLPNNCKATEPKLSKSQRGWRIWYRFHDPAHPKPKFVEFKNFEKTATATRSVIREIINNLERGYNPFTKSFSTEFEINPLTPFIRALELALESKEGVSHTKEDIRSTIKYVAIAAKALYFDTLPIDSIRRRHIKTILLKLSATKKNWSNNQWNSYRKNLSILFEELIQADATEVNAVHGLQKRKHAPKKRETLIEQECNLIDRFAFEYDERFHRLIHIFFHSGSRTTELFRVQGQDVNLEKQIVKYHVLKGRNYEWVERPIKDSVLHFWKEAMKGCKPEDYVFSKGLVPGANSIRPEQVSRRWRRHIKDKLGITCDWYSLKYLNTTSTIDMMEEMRAMQKEAAIQTGHKSEAMIVGIYDTKATVRKLEQMKKINNKFGS